MNAKTVLRAVGYARYSTDKQTENSIQYQKSAITKYCETNGWQLQGFYADEATTGTNLDRQGLQDLIKAAKQKFFDAVVIYDISRGSRNIGDWFTFRTLMSELGVKVIAVSQELGDLTDPNSFFRESIEVSVAHFEVLQTRKKSKDGAMERAGSAKFMGGTPPLGYNIVDGEYKINPLEAQWVEKIHLLYLDDVSYKNILKALPEARGKHGKKLKPNALYTILKNPRYDGTYVWNQRECKKLRKWAGGRKKSAKEIVKIENAIPAIVSPEIKRRVLAKMKSKEAKINNAAKRDYLLAGLIKCEICGATFQGRTVRNSRGYETVSYVCGNKYKYHEGHSRCKAKNIPGIDLEAFVVTQLKHYLQTADFTEIAKEIVRQLADASQDLSKEKAELKQIDIKLNNGMKAILDGMYFPELQEEMDRLRLRKGEIEDIIALSKINNVKVTVEDIVEIFKDSVKMLSEKNIASLLRLHVDKIYAHTDGSVTVNLGVVCDTGCGSPQQVAHTTLTFRKAA